MPLPQLDLEKKAVQELKVSPYVRHRSVSKASLGQTNTTNPKATPVRASQCIASGLPRLRDSLDKSSLGHAPPLQCL